MVSSSQNMYTAALWLAAFSSAAKAFQNVPWATNHNREAALSSSPEWTSHRTRIAHKLHAFQLVSALESVSHLIGEVDSELDLDYQGKSSLLNWMDPRSEQPTPSSSSMNENTDLLETLPLYPLPVVYLPDPTVNHTLRNIEPRKIQMALDLEQMDNPRFCVALRAMDTGRLARTATVLRVVHMEKHYWDNRSNATLSRIILTCQAEPDLVDLVDIVNPQAAHAEHRLRKSTEYLQAVVQKRPRSNTVTRMRSSLADERSSYLTSLSSNHEEIVMEEQVVDDPSFRSLCQETADAFNEVRSMYLSNDGAILSNLPPFAMQQLPDKLLAVTAQDFVHESSFWRVANTWQMLCNTCQAGRQMALSSDRDEMLVEAAMKQGGPLKLPIHLEDVSPQVRREVSQMELTAQREWILQGLDPCLDFQLLVTLQSQDHRVRHFASMVTRERQRLERLVVEERHHALQDSSSNGGGCLGDDSSSPPVEEPKGAWFRDEYW